MAILPSYNRAQRTHRSAIRVHTTLFSGLWVNLAMNSHSAANRKNLSAGSTAGLLLVAPDRQNPNRFKMFHVEIEFEYSPADEGTPIPRAPISLSHPLGPAEAIPPVKQRPRPLHNWP
jgi:hypothetical protein